MFTRLSSTWYSADASAEMKQLRETCFLKNCHLTNINYCVNIQNFLLAQSAYQFLNIFQLLKVYMMMKNSNGSLQNIVVQDGSAHLTFVKLKLCVTFSTRFCQKQS